MALEASKIARRARQHGRVAGVCSTTGLQPASISNPSTTSRLAWLNDFTKLGLASMKCGSSVPLAKAVTDTLSPPIVWTRLAKSGTLQQTCSPWACAAEPANRQDTNGIAKIVIPRISGMSTSHGGTPLELELMGWMRTKHELRSQPERMGILGGKVLGIIEIVLEIEPRELGEVPGQQRRQAVAVVAERVVVVADGNKVAIQAVASAPDVFIPQADGPLRFEAVQVLGVEAPVGEHLARQREVRGRVGRIRARRTCRPNSGGR